MLEQRPDIIRTLTDFFLECGGVVGLYRPVTDDALGLYEELLRYRLITLEDHEDQENIHWTAALTQEGQLFCLDYFQMEENETQTLPIQETLTLSFNLRTPKDAETFVALRDLIETGDPIEKLNHILRVHKLLESADIDGLLQIYPDLIEAMREKIFVESEEQEQQQLGQLLEEMSAVKALLRGQRVSSPRSDVLHPVIPHTIDGVPKKLDVPQFDVPAYEDEESSELFIVQSDIQAGKRAAENFLKSLRSLQDPHHLSESE